MYPIIFLTSVAMRQCENEAADLSDDRRISIDDIIKSFQDKKTKLNSVAFSPQANYTERPPLVGEVSVNFCG
jgi:hypothetical protein